MTFEKHKVVYDSWPSHTKENDKPRIKIPLTNFVFSLLAKKKKMFGCLLACLFETGVSLCKPGWPGTFYIENSTSTLLSYCLSFPSIEFMGMNHHTCFQCAFVYNSLPIVFVQKMPLRHLTPLGLHGRKADNAQDPSQTWSANNSRF